MQKAIAIFLIPEKTCRQGIISDSLVQEQCRSFEMKILIPDSKRMRDENFSSLLRNKLFNTNS
ncbi:hypothetical protein LI82_07820 [Methanococcoides methylutens]|uniref:Uncharacterized protein n=1 Tax=Methanococcoides methylutens TaxID=2226 RepID=A0A099T0R6_METMT|nr:hypothetical protein LI82_07820 [Methanococcoides methylutens]